LTTPRPSVYIIKFPTPTNYLSLYRSLFNPHPVTRPNWGKSFKGFGGIGLLILFNKLNDASPWKHLGSGPAKAEGRIRQTIQNAAGQISNLGQAKEEDTSLEPVPDRRAYANLRQQGPKAVEESNALAKPAAETNSERTELLTP